MCWRCWPFWSFSRRCPVSGWCTCWGCWRQGSVRWGCCTGTPRPGSLAGRVAGGIGCLGGFVLARTMLQDRPLRMVSASEYALLFLDFLLWAGLLLWSCRADAAPKREKPPLFKEQVPDKARLIQYIQDLPIVGIHAKWGNGKSFLWENLRSDLQAQFEIVQIDLLACDLDQIEAFLIRELEKVLERGQIYPENAHYLKAQLGKNSALEKLGSIAGESGFSDTFDSLQQELERLPKKVLLNFEDIDRIRSEEVIQKIFAISEKLASDRVHVVFQYNKEALPGRLQEKEYLEKYVPFNVGLTPISFASLAGYFWDRFEMDDLPLKKDALSLIGVTRPSYETLNSAVGLDAKASFDLTSLVSIRKVQFYLEEVKVLLTSNEEFARQTNAETVAMVLLVKHFFREEYAALQAKTSPLRIFVFETEEGPRTLLELADRYRKPQREEPEAREQRRAALEEVLQRGENSKNLWLLMLLGYQIPFQGGDEERNRKQKVQTEMHNAKIDHLVWNVMANGVSELTDEENEVEELLHKVFYDAKKEEWPARWEAYQLDRIHGRFPKDNTTVMMWGDNALACSFRAMAHARKYAKVQTQLLELLIELERAKENPAVSDVLLECLSYCDWSNGQDLILMADFFATLKGEENPEHLPFYRTFFQNAMEAIVLNRYCERMESFMFEWSDKDGFAEHETKQLKYLKQELEEEREKQTVPFLQEELDTLIRFVEKNTALLSSPAPMPQRKSGWKVGEWRSEYIHQTEIDRLKEYRKTHTQADFEQELQKSRGGAVLRRGQGSFKTGQINETIPPWNVAGSFRYSVSRTVRAFRMVSLLVCQSSNSEKPGSPMGTPSRRKVIRLSSTCLPERWKAEAPVSLARAGRLAGETPAPTRISMRPAARSTSCRSRGAPCGALAAWPLVRMVERSSPQAASSAAKGSRQTSKARWRVRATGRFALAAASWAAS